MKNLLILVCSIVMIGSTCFSQVDSSLVTFLSSVSEVGKGEQYSKIEQKFGAFLYSYEDKTHYYQLQSGDEIVISQKRGPDFVQYLFTSEEKYLFLFSYLSSKGQKREVKIIDGCKHQSFQIFGNGCVLSSMSTDNFFIFSIISL